MWISPEQFPVEENVFVALSEWSLCPPDAALKGDLWNNTLTAFGQLYFIISVRRTCFHSLRGVIFPPALCERRWLLRFELQAAIRGLIWVKWKWALKTEWVTLLFLEAEVNLPEQFPFWLLHNCICYSHTHRYSLIFTDCLLTWEKTGV